MEKDYKKLGGWLLFWLVYFCLTVVLVINNLMAAMKQLDTFEILNIYYPSSNWALVLYLRIGIVILILISFIVIVVLMLKKTKKSLATIKLILIVSTIVDMGSMIIYLVYFGSLLKTNLFDSDQFLNLGITLGVASIAIAYFCKSKRAAVYFDENYVEPIETLEVIID